MLNISLGGINEIVEKLKECSMKWFDWLESFEKVFSKHLFAVNEYSLDKFKN